MNLKPHTWITFAILALLVVAFNIFIGWDATDASKLLTHHINVFNYWLLVSLFAFIYNGFSYNTWSIISADADSNSRVLGAILIGTALVLGRSF